MCRAGKIYIVATPIGNLGDISKRAIDVLQSCDCIYCEDTRVTGKLLNALGITNKLIRLDENLIRKKADIVIDKVLAGETICYCTDAGMPCVSDPGSALVSRAHDLSVEVSIVPGPSACESAYALSGFNSNSYTFKGFLPKKKVDLEKSLKDILNSNIPTVIYESPNRILNTLNTMLTLNRKRSVFCIKEITKIHEMCFRGPVAVVFEELSNADPEIFKGEWVIVIDGMSDGDAEDIRHKQLELARMYANDKKQLGQSSTDVKNDLIKYFNVTKNTAFELANP